MSQTPSRAYWAGELTAYLTRIPLYGFILAGPGVPFVPWGEPAGVAVALAAIAAVLGLRWARGKAMAALCVVVVGCAVLVSRTDAVSTSLLLGGAVVAAITQTARERPVVYGGVAGAFVAGIIVQVFDLQLVKGGELIFSGEPFSPDAAGRQAVLVAAVVFMAAMHQIVASEMKTQKSRAEAAEAARDAAASDERARIARELHDVVSHHVTAMTLQAEAAAATGDKGALASLASSGREASAELRRMLGVLRRPSDDDAAAAAEPQPQLSDIDGLARRLTGGLEVKLDKRGRVRPLPAGVELCAYRVVQEALTNVAKHSDARRATVAIDYGDRELTLEILDDGRPTGARAGEGGHGLIGMGERVSLLEGTLQAGERTDGPGYRVFARIPLQA